MAGHTYKMMELVGSSDVSIEDAIQTAVSRAAQTIKHMDWFEVIQTRGEIEDGKIRWYQVTLKIGFRVLSEEELHAS